MPSALVLKPMYVCVNELCSGVFRIWQRGGHGERKECEPITGVEAEPPAGSRGGAPGRGKHFLLLNVQWKPQIRPFF